LTVIVLVLILLVYYPQSGIITKVQAGLSMSTGWEYSGWLYRKANNITLNQNITINFYDISDPWSIIIGNPTNRHAFQPSA